MTEACTSMQHGARPGATPGGSCHGSMAAAAAAAEAALARGPSSLVLEGPSIAPEATAGQAGQPSVCQASTSSTERDAWAADMRRRFSPPAMLDAAGNIMQEFFKPKCVLIVNERRWGTAESELLLQGLERHGVGRWREISATLLPAWEEQQLRVRAARLLGSQSLARYVAWKGDKQAVQREYAKNKAIGEATGCWKNGMLVEDEQGSVKAYLDAQGVPSVEPQPAPPLCES